MKQIKKIAGLLVLTGMLAAAGAQAKTTADPYTKAQLSALMQCSSDLHLARLTVTKAFLAQTDSAHKTYLATRAAAKNEYNAAIAAAKTKQARQNAQKQYTAKNVAAQQAYNTTVAQATAQREDAILSQNATLSTCQAAAMLK